MSSSSGRGGARGGEINERRREIEIKKMTSTLLAQSPSSNDATIHTTTRSRLLLVTDESTMGALDALAALASGMGGDGGVLAGYQPSSNVTTNDAPSSLSSYSNSYSYSSSATDADGMTTTTEITPLMTSSHDDGSESLTMPLPAPRVANVTTPATLPAAPPSSTSSFSHGFSFLHSYDAPPSYPPPSSASSGRLRSASNPEGMEKWDLYGHRNDRLHFVLPSSILEEELESTRRVLGEQVDDEYRDHWRGEEGGDDDRASSSRAGGRGRGRGRGGGVRRSARRGGTTTSSSSSSTARLLGTSPDSVSFDLDVDDARKANGGTRKKIATKLPGGATESRSSEDDGDGEYNDDQEEEEEEEGQGDLEDGEELEPDNKNGRIGIYTPAKRAAIIQKFNAKRARRVWLKYKKMNPERRAAYLSKLMEIDAAGMAYGYGDAPTNTAPV